MTRRSVLSPCIRTSTRRCSCRRATPCTCRRDRRGSTAPSGSTATSSSKARLPSSPPDSSPVTATGNVTPNQTVYQRGQAFTYHILVSNPAATPVVGLTLNDPLPSTVVPVTTAAPNPECSARPRASTRSASTRASTPRPGCTCRCGGTSRWRGCKAACVRVCGSPRVDFRDGAAALRTLRRARGRATRGDGLPRRVQQSPRADLGSTTARRRASDRPAGISRRCGLSWVCPGPVCCHRCDR